MWQRELMAIDYAVIHAEYHWRISHPPELDVCAFSLLSLPLPGSLSR
jgi:hypothetical protein